MAVRVVVVGQHTCIFSLLKGHCFCFPVAMKAIVSVCFLLQRPLLLFSVCYGLCCYSRNLPVDSDDYCVKQSLWDSN